MKGSISLIKEISPLEKRVLLTPVSVGVLVSRGFDLLVETGAGASLGFTDATYHKAGAGVVEKSVAWKGSRLVLKYKAPLKNEFKFFREDLILGAIFHAEGDARLTSAMLHSRMTAYSFEFFRDSDGKFPLAAAGGTIAGHVAVLFGAYFLQTHIGGKGKLLGLTTEGCEVKILIIGSGNVARAAANFSLRMGGRVTILCSSENSRLKLLEEFGSAFEIRVNSPSVLWQEVRDTDILIGAILISTFDTPPMLTEDMVKSMQPGSVIIDVTCGYGSGYMPTFARATSLQNPVFENFGVTHCKIDNLPAGFPVSTVALVNKIYLPYLIAFAESIYDPAISDSVSHAGKIIEDGRLIHPELIRHSNLKKGL